MPRFFTTALFAAAALGAVTLQSGAASATPMVDPAVAAAVHGETSGLQQAYYGWHRRHWHRGWGWHHHRGWHHGWGWHRHGGWRHRHWRHY